MTVRLLTRGLLHHQQLRNVLRLTSADMMPVFDERSSLQTPPS